MRDDFVEPRNEESGEFDRLAEAKRKLQPVMFTKFGPLAIASPVVASGLVLYVASKVVSNSGWWEVLVWCTAFVVFMYMWHKFIFKNPLLEKGIFVTILPYIVGGSVLIAGLLQYSREGMGLFVVIVAYLTFSITLKLLTPKSNGNSSSQNLKS